MVLPSSKMLLPKNCPGGKNDDKRGSNVSVSDVSYASLLASSSEGLPVIVSTATLVTPALAAALGTKAD